MLLRTPFTDHVRVYVVYHARCSTWIGESRNEAQEKKSQAPTLANRSPGPDPELDLDLARMNSERSGGWGGDTIRSPSGEVNATPSVPRPCWRRRCRSHSPTGGLSLVARGSWQQMQICSARGRRHLRIAGSRRLIAPSDDNEIPPKSKRTVHTSMTVLHGASIFGFCIRWT
jgi:hypothetical protein